MTEENEVHKVDLAVGVKMTPTLEKDPTLYWDGASLTLAGVIYSILVAVAGVIVASQGPLVKLAYVVISVGLLVLGLAYNRGIIRLMRRILSHPGDV
jgi:hypothetical protein